ncbi:hypothetical protein J6590_080364 [Homalodisca vitripennis]|nr:hypothetical protein J6590_080364 [Homalodisca vitripennis]
MEITILSVDAVRHLLPVESFSLMYCGSLSILALWIMQHENISDMVRKRKITVKHDTDIPYFITNISVLAIEHGGILKSPHQIMSVKIKDHKSTVIVVPASRFFSKLQNGGALPMPLPVLPDTSATDELTRRFSSFADCEWNCCVYVVKLVFDILGRCVVCTRNGLRKETIYVCETCTARRTCTRIRVSRRTTR